MRTRTWGAAVIVALAVAGCGSEEVLRTGPTTSTTRTTTTTKPTAPSDGVVVQLVGGQAHVDDSDAVRAVPPVTVLADGTVITPAIVTAIYPGPALLPLRATTLTPAQLAELLATARRLGLADAPLDFGNPSTGTATTTTLRIVVDGHAVTQRVYSYGDDRGLDLTAQQRERRGRFDQFVTMLHALPPGRRSWTPQSVVVVFRGIVTTPSTTINEHIFGWPIRTLPRMPRDRGAVGCVVITGAEARTLLRSLATATAIDMWSVGGQYYALAFRPLVPGAPACT